MAQARSRLRPRRTGFTLFEVIVVLAVLGLLSALVVPSILSNPPVEADEVQGVIDSVRRVAVRSAAARTLAFEPDGHWAATSGALGPTYSSGTVAWRPRAPLRLHVSPLGGCTLEGAAGRDGSLRLDPVRCRLSRGSQP